MSFMKSRFFVEAMLILSLFFLASPAHGGGKGGALTIMMGLGEYEWEVMRGEIIPPFEKESGIKVRAIQAEADDAIRKLDAMHRAGKMKIDLITQDNMKLAPLVERGLVQDLSAHRDLIPEEAIRSLVEVGEFNDGLYFLPYRPNVQVAYYNSEKFKKYGLIPPRDWDELLRVARTFKEKEGTGRVAIHGAMDANTTTHIYEFIRSAGGDPLSLDDKGSAAAFAFLRSLYPYLSPDSRRADWNTTNTFLARESVYLARNWPFGINIVVREAGKREIKVYHGWRGPEKEAHVLGGEVIGIPAGAPNGELALKFARYLTSRRVQEKLLNKLGWPPSRRDAYTAVSGWLKPYFEAVAEALSHSEPRPNVVYWAEVDKALNGAYREIVVEGAEVEATLKKYHAMLVRAKGGHE